MGPGPGVGEGPVPPHPTRQPQHIPTSRTRGHMMRSYSSPCIPMMNQSPSTSRAVSRFALAVVKNSSSSPLKLRSPSWPSRSPWSSPYMSAYAVATSAKSAGASARRQQRDRTPRSVAVLILSRAGLDVRRPFVITSRAGLDFGRTNRAACRPVRPNVQDLRRRRILTS